MLWRMHHLVYRGFAQTGSTPAIDALAGQLGIPEREALGLLRELAGRNANPFSAVPTPFRVTANGVDAWANCAWDMLGVPAATIYATCAVDDAPAELRIQGGEVSGAASIVHGLEPLRMWYGNILNT